MSLFDDAAGRGDAIVGVGVVRDGVVVVVVLVLMSPVSSVSSVSSVLLLW